MHGNTNYTPLGERKVSYKLDTADRVELELVVVVVYHVTIVAIDLGCWRNFGLLW